VATVTPPHSRAERFRRDTSAPGAELAYAGLPTFLKSEVSEVDELEQADVAVLGAPYDGAASNRSGARYGPAAVRRASGWWAYLSGYKGGLTNVETGQQVDYDAFTCADCGDVPVFPMDRERTAESITAHVATAAQETFPVLIGGDHYCTYPAVRGVAESRGYDRVGLVQIDAHTDTVEGSELFGDHFHGSSTRHVAESPWGDFENVSQIGVRGYESPGFFEFADDVGLNLFPMTDVDERGIRSVVRDAVDRAAEGADAVYVTIDIDAVDPMAAPGTGTPEPGGLTPRQVLTAARTLGRHDSVVAADLMEVAPDHDPTSVTSHLGAYLLVSLLEQKFAT
jgi:agmatinase